ncbi:hypothetical protein OAV67_04775 [Alphaproteobacteria bacterium]|nr:hypothetical protein [Alphaproteobacteria bacterium]
MSVGIVLSYFLIREETVIIDQLVSYFQQKELSEEPAASVPTMHLNEKYLTNATDGLFSAQPEARLFPQPITRYSLGRRCLC